MGIKAPEIEKARIGNQTGHAADAFIKQRQADAPHPGQRQKSDENGRIIDDRKNNWG